MTRIAIPTAGPGGLDDRLAEHFGRAPTFTFVDAATEQVEVIPNRSEHMGGQGMPADLLADSGADVVLCTGLGRRAIGLLSQHGIVVHRVEPGTVRQAVAEWKRGELDAVTDDDACTRRVFHDHGQ
jgi:predicted Fe-Mo cluster-binding NifX family protein